MHLQESQCGRFIHSLTKHQHPLVRKQSENIYNLWRSAALAKQAQKKMKSSLNSTKKTPSPAPENSIPQSEGSSDQGTHFGLLDLTLPVKTETPEQPDAQTSLFPVIPFHSLTHYLASTRNKSVNLFVKSLKSSDADESTVQRIAEEIEEGFTTLAFSLSFQSPFSLLCVIAFICFISLSII